MHFSKVKKHTSILICLADNYLLAPLESYRQKCNSVSHCQYNCLLFQMPNVLWGFRTFTFYRWLFWGPQGNITAGIFSSSRHSRTLSAGTTNSSLNLNLCLFLKYQHYLHSFLALLPLHVVYSSMKGILSAFTALNLRLFGSSYAVEDLKLMSLWVVINSNILCCL